jgi:hypothetical protein
MISQSLDGGCCRYRAARPSLAKTNQFKSMGVWVSDQLEGLLMQQGSGENLPKCTNLKQQRAALGVSSAARAAGAARGQ